MKRIRIVIGIILLVFLSSGYEKLVAQEQADGQWTTYTTANGLPFNEVGAITFGPEGDLWCVLVPPGGGGVAHFDGNTWEHHTNEDGLGSDVILWFENALTVSSDGELWVATFDGGVSRYDGEVWTIYTTEDGLLSDMVTAVAIAPDGDLWCTHPMPECGISQFDGDSWTAYPSNDIGVSSCNLLNIAFDPDSALWATGSHVLRYHDESWTNFSTQTGMEFALYMDIGPDGKIWIGGEGISCYEGSAWTHYSLADIGAKDKGELMPLAVDSENVLWVGISDEIDEKTEVIRYDGQSWTEFAPEGGPTLKGVYSIAVGPDSTMWFGTNYGLFQYNEIVPLTNLPYRNENTLSLYPNPFTDWIVIKGKREMEAYVSVSNILGNILLEESCKGKNEFHINTANLPEGIYLVRITSDENISTYRIIKQ